MVGLRTQKPTRIYPLGRVALEQWYQRPTCHTLEGLTVIVEEDVNRHVFPAPSADADAGENTDSQGTAPKVPLNS